jgi:integrase
MIGAHINSNGEYYMRRNEKPLRRPGPGGKVRWVARYRNRAGDQKSAGTFDREGPCKRPDKAEGKCCAQHRIWWAYEQDVPAEEKPVTVQAYFEETWLTRHPRMVRTENTYQHAVRAVLEVKAQGRRFGDVPLREVRPRHADDLIAALLKKGRAASGVRQVMSVLSAMWTDAIRDDLAEMNPMHYVSVRDNDPRVQRPKRRRRVASWEEMHAFAIAAGEHEPMIRVLSDCGLRIGELLALECKHVRGDVLAVEQSAWRGSVSSGTKSGDEREVPLPPRLGSLLALARRDRIGVLFPGPDGRVWHASRFYKLVWNPAREASGMDLQPHDFRHSYVSLMRAAGVDPADLARICGHTVGTATSRYTHATGDTFDLVRSAVG